MNNRNKDIDILRFIGLSLIILAHVHAPYTIMQIRCFDVPLMLFVSGLAYGNRETTASWRKFYLPRIKKLLIPAYLFVFCDLAAFAFTNRLPETSILLKTLFLCDDGAVGCIWIFKVFLLIMLVTPILTKINRRMSYVSFLVLMFFLFLLQGVLIWIMQFVTTAPWDAIYRETLPYLTGYAIPFLLGLRLRNSDKRQENITLLITTALFVTSFGLYYINHRAMVEPTPFYKYPPQSYFIIYGLFASAILWKLRNQLNFLTKSKTFVFIGQNTTWIYIWHIVFVTIANHLLDNWAL